MKEQHNYEQRVIKALEIALVRTGISGVDDNKIKEIKDDIIHQFGKRPLKFLFEAIKDGGFGKYGRSYRFSVQEVGYWINKKIEDERKKSYGKL